MTSSLNKGFEKKRAQMMSELLNLSVKISLLLFLHFNFSAPVK
jgi:hypothetical protein